MADESSKTDSSEPAEEPAPRDDEYADHAVQTFRVATSSTLKKEKKIVIASREAETVKVRHDDVPALAAAIARERARKEAENASIDGAPASGPISQGPRSSARGDPSWVEDGDSFNPETFSAEHDEPKAAQSPRKSSAGVLLLVLGVVAAAGAGVVIYLDQMETRADPARGAEVVAAPSASASGRASASAVVTSAAPEADSSGEQPIAQSSGAVATSASAEVSSPRPPLRAPKPRSDADYPDL